MTTPDVQHLSAQPIDILLVEDDDDDVLLTTKALEKDPLDNRIHRVEDGVEAMAFLRQQGDYRRAPRPDLILLDLNMPRKDGREVLREIKEDPALRSIPVVVLTTSEADTDIHDSYDYRANSYVTKPVNLAQFRNVIRLIKEYWFELVRLPNGSPDKAALQSPGNLDATRSA